MTDKFDCTKIKKNSCMKKAIRKLKLKKKQTGKSIYELYYR